jgi:hypothetical protein
LQDFFLNSLPYTGKKVEVTPRTDNLLAEIKEWCDAQYGRRSELAKAAGTTPQIVTDWFASPRRKTPTAEQALAILELLKKERRARAKR